MEKIYITFGSAHGAPNAERGLTVHTDGWWEVIAPNYQVARAVAWAAFDGVFAFDYTEESWDPKWYKLGCLGTITVESKPVQQEDAGGYVLLWKDSDGVSGYYENEDGAPEIFTTRELAGEEQRRASMLYPSMAYEVVRQDIAEAAVYQWKGKGA